MVRIYFPELTPMSAIRRYSRRIVEKFHPDKVILFGSYANGTATPDSDVDLLVVMPTEDSIEQAVCIDEAIEERGFPLDLLVRTPEAVIEQIRNGNSFVEEIVTRGKVLYEKVHATVGTQSRKRPRRGPTSLHPQARSER